MAKLSAGLLPFRVSNDVLEVFIVHPGGPFWAKKDEGAWSVAKGEYEEGEDPLAVACREFEEEVGLAAPEGERLELGAIKQPSGKVITAFAVEANFEIDAVKSNTFEMEWPPKSGKQQEFPEVDRAEWFQLAQARIKLLKGQLPILDALRDAVSQSRVFSEGETPQPPEIQEQESLF